MFALIKRLAARTTGVRSTEVPGVEPRRANIHMCRLTAKGVLHRATLARQHVRYFAHAGQRDAFVKTWNEGHRDEFLKTWFVPATVGGNAQWSREDKAIETERTVRTICPPFVPRFFALDLPNIHGGNQRGRVAA